ncbi:hypothetical protein GAYE_SCF12G3267 [Galdieria yellowstonensis]|uniref:Uncharacterized protein n=1 Tax=Galdieria yellowstonensis TaxID=3028027 RepID=A0AAV9IDE8_9RHOD|nr:hypothetical protein GAYE_SCF12G3267 [Galdieria yellowstonensis]
MEQMDLEFPTDSAAFHVMPSIHFQIASKEQGGSSRCYTSENKLPQGTDIPERCEVVILCEEDVESFIGASTLWGVRRAFTWTENPNLTAIENPSLKDMCCIRTK